jgi:hypothetical protein
LLVKIFPNNFIKSKKIKIKIKKAKNKLISQKKSLSHSNQSFLLNYFDFYFVLILLVYD